MKTRGVIGARIVAVRQERRQMNHGPVSHILAIELDNGRVLTFSVAEGEGDYAIDGTNHAPGDVAMERQITETLARVDLACLGAKTPDR